MATFSPRARISRSLGSVTAARAAWAVDDVGLEWALMLMSCGETGRCLDSGRLGSRGADAARGALCPGPRPVVRRCTKLGRKSLIGASKPVKSAAASRSGHGRDHRETRREEIHQRAHA